MWQPISYAYLANKIEYKIKIEAEIIKNIPCFCQGKNLKQKSCKQD